MNITVSKDGAISFTQMAPTTARLLIDLATDVSSGRAVLRYEDAVVGPTHRAVQSLSTVPRTYDKHTVPPIGDGPWSDFWSPV